MLPQTARRLFADFARTRFATAVIALVALVGVLATMEKLLMAARMIEKFGFQDRVPVVFNPSTFYVFIALSIGCVAVGVARLTRKDIAVPALERLALKSALLIHVCVLMTFALMLGFGYAIAWTQ